MKILHISNSDSDGAGIAAYRILEAQRESGLDVHLIVRDNNMNKSNVSSFYHFKYVDYFLNQFLRLFGLNNIFSFNGFFLVRSKLFKNADIIHIHNIHYTRLLFPTQLPVSKKYIYTLHDMWAITGYCNYTYNECEKFITGCGNCPQLISNKDYGYDKMLRDKTDYHWKLKNKAYSRLNIAFTAPSIWLSKLAISSNIINNKTVYHVPNCVKNDEVAVCKIDKKEDSILKLLFVGQKQNNNNRKGFDYIVKLSNMLDVNHELNIVGKNKKSIEDLFINKKCKIIIHGPLDYDRMKEQYRYNDMLILPTLMDNFPNTILESFSSNTPVVAFDVGGVKDLVSLETGYLSKYKSTESLLTGVLYVKENLSFLSSNINKMKSKYSYKMILKEYNNIYKSL